MNLEITQPPETPGRFSGMSSLQCSAGTREQRINPESALLDGFAQAESIEFKIIQTISSDAHGCAFSAVTVTPSPVGNQLAVQFKEDSCAGGSLILRRMAR